jgi:misacylated tRNA(Ala) deacylase
MMRAAATEAEIFVSRSFYHLHPDTLNLVTEVLDAAPGRVLLAQSPFFAGGGGQLADRGRLLWSGGEIDVAGFERLGDQTWALLKNAIELSGSVEARVDPEFRQMMRELHTDTHLLNAFVFQAFNGALVTGVQLNDDGTARMDFDLPDAENERLKALEAPINEAIRADFPVSDCYVPLAQATQEHGLIRTRSAMPPPTPDGTVRVVEIGTLDRQVCGGTHLASTGQSRPIRVLKIENKGRHNRRIRIGLAGD